jgi:hypothetical protein
MTLKIPTTVTLSAGSTDRVTLDCTPDLDGSELVASATVAEVSTSALTIANLAGTPNVATVNAATVVVLKETVAIGKAIQFMVSGGTAGAAYLVLVTLTTDSTPARVLTRDIEIAVV